MKQKLPIAKKIFFLLPHPVIREILVELVDAGYEVYAIEEKADLLKLLQLFPNTITYLNFDIGKEHEWEEFIRQVRSSTEIINAKIGIFTFDNLKKEKYAQYYLSLLRIECGFIVLNSEQELCKKIILHVLELNEAKGLRKFVRAVYTTNAFFNIKYQHIYYTGEIKDISAAGMACFFSVEDILLEENKMLHDIQLVLRGVRCSVDGSIMKMQKMADRKCYIIMFDLEHMAATTRQKLNKCIFLRIQEDIKGILLQVKDGKS